MRCPVHERNHSTAGFKRRSLLERMSIKHIHRQSLLFSFIDAIGFRCNADRKFARRQPVGLESFAWVPHQRESTNGEKFFYIFGTELGIVIKEKQRASTAWIFRIL